MGENGQGHGDDLPGFGTTLLTPDNVLTTVGNGNIFAEVIQNYSAMPVRRVDRTPQFAGGWGVTYWLRRCTSSINCAFRFW